MQFQIVSLVLLVGVAMAEVVMPPIPTPVQVKHQCDTAADCNEGQCCKLDYTGLIASKRQLMKLREPIRKCMDFIAEDNDCAGLQLGSCGCVKGTRCTRLDTPLLVTPKPFKPIAVSKRARVAFGEYACRPSN